jgi:hypothetical protein
MSAPTPLPSPATFFCATEPAQGNDLSFLVEIPSSDEYKYFLVAVTFVKGAPSPSIDFSKSSIKPVTAAATNTVKCSAGSTLITSDTTSATSTIPYVPTVSVLLLSVLAKFKTPIINHLVALFPCTDTDFWTNLGTKPVDFYKLQPPKRCAKNNALLYCGTDKTDTGKDTCEKSSKTLYIIIGIVSAVALLLMLALFMKRSSSN